MEKANSQNNPDNGAWKPFAMSFKSNGVRENTKKIIIAVAAVTAIMEGVIWCEYIWNWWKGEEGDNID
jgi:hypothetical protein